MSPPPTAARNRSVSSAPCRRDASKRGQPSSIRRRARPKIWRQLGSLLPHGPGDLVVSVAEHLAQQEHGPFRRRQALQQHQERQRWRRCDRAARTGVTGRPARRRLPSGLVPSPPAGSARAACRPGPRRTAGYATTGTGAVDALELHDDADTHPEQPRATGGINTASGSSANTAATRLIRIWRVPRSNSRSNQASQHSRVAVTVRQMIRTCRSRQAAHAVVANAASKAKSKPTQQPASDPPRNAWAGSPRERRSRRPGPRRSP